MAARLVAASSIPLYIFVSPLCLGTGIGIQEVVSSILIANYIFLMYPQSHERPREAFMWAVAMLVVELASLIFLPDIPPLIPLTVVFLANIVRRTVKKTGNLRALFQNDAPLYNMEEWALSVRIAIVLSLSVFNAVIPGWPMLAPAVVVLAAQYYAAYSGHPGIMRRSREECLRNLVKGDLRMNAASLNDEDARMSALYSRVIRCMEEQQPFLEDDFSLEKFSRIMFTNKTYLSKVINSYSGRNFKQFVNYYRVQYSIELIKKDPRLSVMELAQMSGFHSTVTYNMAFRINMNDTPGAFSKGCSRDLFLSSHSEH